MFNFEIQKALNMAEKLFLRTSIIKQKTMKGLILNYKLIQLIYDSKA